MYKSFEIRNFRCFHELRIDPLERLNLITGKNNVGKTSILEAIFLHVGFNNPELPVRINVFRGIEYMAVDPEILWGPIFYQKQTDQDIELEGTDDNDQSETLKISLVEKDEYATAQPVSGVSTTTTTTTVAPIEPLVTSTAGSRELLLEYLDASGSSILSSSFINPEGRLMTKPANPKHKRKGVFLPARVRFLQADADRFSELDRVKNADQLLNFMKILEPRLERLSVLSQGGFSTINGDIGLTELVPVPLMGEGMVRLLSILLAILDSEGGAVMIDEIENGFHYSVLPKVWEAIAMAARQSDVQVFATTHSWECIKASHDVFVASKLYDFRLHRLDRLDGEIKVVGYKKEMLTTAINTGLEYR